MSIIFKIYGNLADIQGSTASNATYSVVRDSTVATGSSANTTVLAGQRWSGSLYSTIQYFTQFDTSTVPTGTGPTTLTLTCTVVALATDDSYEVREAPTGSNKIAGASLAALPLYSTLALPTTTGAKVFTFSDITALSRSSTLWLLVHSQKERLNTAPTGDNRTTFSTADTTGTTSDPVLQGQAGTSWTYVNPSPSLVAATATSHVLQEPSGAAQNDLLVACIASRIASTTSITLPSGWALVSEQKTNNVLTTGSAVASAMMAYIVRGSSAPSYTFTHPVAPSIALGSVFCYRNVNTSSPKDTQTSFTTAVSITAVSGTGLTTTQDDDLIVAMCAGGQEAAWSAFNATDPGTSSGTTSFSNLDPIFGQWLEREDTLVTTGADTSLAVYDAIKQTAGATGNLTATASVAASHAVVAGAFKLVPAATGATYNDAIAEATTAAAETLTGLAARQGPIAEAGAAAETVASLLGTIRATEAGEDRIAENGEIRVIDAAVTLNLAVLETAAAADTVGGLLAAGGAIAESGAAVDTISKTLAFTSAIAETAAAADTVAGQITYTAAIAETAAAADTVTGLAATVSAIAESAAAVDTVAGSLTFAAAIAESATAAETLTGGLAANVTVAETAAAADTVTKTVSFTDAVAETLSAADTVGGLAIRIGAIAEVASAAETIGGLLATTAAIAETAGAAETITYSIVGAGGTTFNEAVLESVAAAETVASVGLLAGAIAEAASAADTTTKTVSYTKAIVETAASAETITALAAATGAVAETAAAAETITGRATFAAVVAESASAVDTVVGAAPAATYDKAVVEVAAAVDTVSAEIVHEFVPAAPPVGTNIDAVLAAYFPGIVVQKNLTDAIGYWLVTQGPVTEADVPAILALANAILVTGEVPARLPTTQDNYGRVPYPTGMQRWPGSNPTPAGWTIVDTEKTVHGGSS